MYAYSVSPEMDNHAEPGVRNRSSRWKQLSSNDPSFRGLESIVLTVTGTSRLPVREREVSRKRMAVDRRLGPLITLSQFTTVALFTLPGHVSWDAGLRGFFLARRAIPLRSWLAYTAFFMSVNMLNNWAFAYRISVPLHIILRSAGPVASMAVGYLFNGRRYSPGQILAVVLLTCGVCGAALADAQAQGRSIHVGPDAGTSAGSFFTGIIILAIAMLLAAFQGVYVDRLYATHGNSHWREALFYSHLLSLPFFLPTYGQLTRQFRQMLTSPPLFETAASKSLLRFLDHLPGPVLRTLAGAPSLIIYLVLNGLTQYACIRGVYLLAAKSSSLTVTIVLNIRKLVSLLLSIYLFGNRLAPGVLLGAVLVFLGGALYGIEGARRRRVVKVA